MRKQDWNSSIPPFDAELNGLSHGVSNIIASGPVHKIFNEIQQQLQFSPEIASAAPRHQKELLRRHSSYYFTNISWNIWLAAKNDTSFESPFNSASKGVMLDFQCYFLITPELKSYEKNFESQILAGNVLFKNGSKTIKKIARNLVSSIGRIF